MSLGLSTLSLGQMSLLSLGQLEVLPIDGDSGPSAVIVAISTYQPVRAGQIGIPLATSSFTPLQAVDHYQPDQAINQYMPTAAVSHMPE